MADLAGGCFEQVSDYLQAACDLIARCWGANSWPVRRRGDRIGNREADGDGRLNLRSPSRSLSKQRISNSPDGREN
jgi:hypothetical protein